MWQSTGVLGALHHPFDEAKNRDGIQKGLDAKKMVHNNETHKLASPIRHNQFLIKVECLFGCHASKSVEGKAHLKFSQTRLLVDQQRILCR